MTDSTPEKPTYEQLEEANYILRGQLANSEYRAQESALKVRDQLQLLEGTHQAALRQIRKLLNLREDAA